jgi:hypothetical protein
MDTETSQIIERLGGRIDALENSLRGEIAAMGSGLRGEMATMREELRDEIRASLDESKRYAQVLNEDVRDDIRMLAESFAAMSVKLDSLQR